jgi:hypothetical protein
MILSCIPLATRRIGTVLLKGPVRIQRRRNQFVHPQATINNFTRNFSDDKKSTEETKLDAEPAESTENEINLADYTREISVTLPDLEESKGKIVTWYKEEGDIIYPNDTICDIETDLFTFGMDVEDEKEGIMKEILIPAGEEKHDPGTPICTILHKPME